MGFLRRDSILFSIYLSTFIYAFCQGLLLPVFPLFVKSFGIPYSLIGVALAAEGIGMLLGDVPSGVLIRRIGKKNAMVIGVCGAAVASFSLFWIGSISLLFLVRLFGGMCISLWNIARHAYLVEEAHPSKRGRAIAGFGGIVRIGTFIGPAAGGFVAARYGMRMPFLVYATLVLAIGIFITVNIKPEGKTESSQTQLGVSRLLQTIKLYYRRLLIAGTGQLFAQMIRVGRMVLIPLYGADVIGLDVQAVGLIMSISWFVDTSMFYPAGLIMDRLGRKFAIIPCFLTQAVGICLIPFTGSFSSLLLVASFIGLGNGLGSGTMMTLGGDLAPRKSRGEFLGVWRLLADAGTSSGPILMGAAATLFGLTAAVLLTGGAGLLSAVIFLFFIPETLRKRRITS